ncbi:MAG: hypothetical protein IPN33_22175 [Saprospiraceae bacterium]|nr:hypothetical protein [Saprospiraceae bacterium]
MEIIEDTRKAGGIDDVTGKKMDNRGQQNSPFAKFLFKMQNKNFERKGLVKSRDSSDSNPDKTSHMNVRNL